MSDDVTAIRALIPDYAGHADVSARRLADQQVRAWIGEALVDLEERLPGDELKDQIEPLLMRCEFGDQHLIKALEDVAFADPGLAERVEAADRALLDAAAPVKTVTPDGVTAFLRDLDTAFDVRAAAIEAAAKLT